MLDTTLSRNAMRRNESALLSVIEFNSTNEAEPGAGQLI